MDERTDVKSTPGHNNRDDWRLSLHRGGGGQGADGRVRLSHPGSTSNMEITMQDQILLLRLSIVLYQFLGGISPASLEAAEHGNMGPVS